MNSIEVEQYVASLVETFPVEDIWYLDSRTAKGCLLDRETNLVVIVSAGANAFRIEEEAAALVRKKFPGTPVGIHVFTQSAMFQTPRPVLVKMAFASGRHVYCG